MLVASYLVSVSATKTVKTYQEASWSHPPQLKCNDIACLWINSKATFKSFKYRCIRSARDVRKYPTIWVWPTKPKIYVSANGKHQSSGAIEEGIGLQRTWYRWRWLLWQIHSWECLGHVLRSFQNYIWACNGQVGKLHLKLYGSGSLQFHRHLPEVAFCPWELVNLQKSQHWTTP